MIDILIIKSTVAFGWENFEYVRPEYNILNIIEFIQ